MALGATGFLTQELHPIGTGLVDARNGFSELIRLTIMWTVHHHWSAGARFEFN